jgi:hypothetical protein
MRKRLARARVPLGFALAAAVLYLAKPSMPTLAIGFPIALAGIIFRASAAGVIRKNASLAQQGLLLVPSALIYPVVIKSEEAYLSQSFGSEFDEFRRSIPSFLPRRLSSKIFESFSLDCYLANREYNASIGFVSIMLIFLLKYVLA